MATRQEVEQKNLSGEDLAAKAAREVADYVEQMEMRAEGASQQGVTPTPSTDDTQIQPVYDDFGQAVMQAAKSKKPNITLPLTEEQTAKGLHHHVFDAIAWAATFCVYMIKKYPGRVFYKANG